MTHHLCLMVVVTTLMGEYATTADEVQLDLTADDEGTLVVTRDGRQVECIPLSGVETVTVSPLKVTV